VAPQKKPIYKQASPGLVRETIGSAEIEFVLDGFGGELPDVG
jgi:hypothetical protein